MITKSAVIIGSGGTVAEAVSFLDQPDVTDKLYIAELFRLCHEEGVRFDIMFGQFCHETADATSVRWRVNRNPAGLGIAADDDPDPARLTGIEAAQVHVWSMLIALGRNASGIILPSKLAGFMNRWQDKYDDPNCPTVQTIDDLNIRYKDANGETHATWAWDENYDPKMVAKINAIFSGEVAMASTPVIHDLATDYALYGLEASEAMILIAKRINNRAGYQPQGIVWHIQDGSTRGSLKYWVGVQASSTVMINKDGSVLNIIPRQHGPWTNGDSSNPSARGRNLISLGGGDANRVSITCEMEGRPGDALTPAQESAAIWWALDVMREFPHIGMDDMYRHADINSVTRPNCPNGYFDGLMAKIQAEIDLPPPRPKPTIDWIRGEVGLDTYNGTDVLKLVGQAVLTNDTTSRYGASTQAKAFKRYKKGQKVVVVGTFNSRWAVVDAGDGAFPRVSMTRLKPGYPLPKDVI